MHASRSYASKKSLIIPRSHRKIHLWEIKCFWSKTPKWSNLALEPQILNKIQIFWFSWIHLTHTPLKSPSLFLKVVENLIYEKLSVFGPKPQNGVILPQTPKFKKNSDIFDLDGSVSLIRFQKVLNAFSIYL